MIYFFGGYRKVVGFCFELEGSFGRVWAGRRRFSLVVE